MGNASTALFGDYTRLEECGRHQAAWLYPNPSLLHKLVGHLVLSSEIIGVSVRLFCDEADGHATLVKVLHSDFGSVPGGICRNIHEAISNARAGMFRNFFLGCSVDLI